jgi:hypothetical protein
MRSGRNRHGGTCQSPFPTPNISLLKDTFTESDGERRRSGSGRIGYPLLGGLGLSVVATAS